MKHTWPKIIVETETCGIFRFTYTLTLLCSKQPKLSSFGCSEYNRVTTLILLRIFICFQIQDVVPVTSYDTAGSFLLLGCENGSVYYIGKVFCFQEKKKV